MTEPFENLHTQVTCGVVCLILLNVIFYSVLFLRKHQGGATCQMDDLVMAATKFMQSNGETSLEQIIKESCKSDVVDKVHIHKLAKALEDSIYECGTKPLNYFPRNLENNILTLFTTWSSGERDKDHLHQNTIINWGAFQPKINMVLFTNDTDDSVYATERGWTVFPVTHHYAGGAPVLRTMFQKVMESFNSTFYGFANGDILFSSNILDTLATIKTKFGYKKPILLTGRRYNIDHVTVKEAASLPNIHSAAKTRGKLFDIYAEDYFITSKSFPWYTVPDLVIGRPAYDNWLVAHARCLDAVVVDTTDTITAVHQTTEKGNKESFLRATPDFNYKLIDKLGLNKNYQSGFITCPEWKSYETLCGALDVYERRSLPEYCKCPKT